ncbi:interferon-stimulated 20 kDa exonuclease-like 2 [Hippoglossus hippoglossus]|uniref:interferon-stimulated 20 kDa exonuclease-like 2 n=1 Tax=Hippoglossus hippoglossus TaxID=8267 RepID=UPI00148D2ACC|nr:interferon-stimulated 20 kDa exonuclease-like 2 [Hippoglossus hippoglossus]XP_034466277.1 interferon-stimulated 20 kDa exonuclease-like 2 [Hippoglossus hippoglossus]XP_035019906.1 interferon-stimulated 20 kDa exonuclease-like 2 [Hippoglossus stenolepis]XP_035019907.1 interferon-stimulated 20 kDa exonuclease-like 2 [Hippoglossus stenolepis]XP_035019908.1 interferon-stimulated 20 kDa exonuclease-like 2 [Hippoglossus stenolepis]XP_035019909.1 interferon-stimulated 20 kDa exonuclease-like 2 [Hi
MSNPTINVCLSGDPAQKRTGKWKNRRFYKDVQHSGQQGYVEGKRRDDPPGGPRHYQTPLHNGVGSAPPSPAASTQSTSLPRPGGTLHCSSWPPASTHRRPASTLTANSRGGHEKPKEPVSLKSAAANPGPSGSSSPKPAATSTAIPTKFLAMDCEMVGTGPKGHISQLARCSIVSYDGDVIYDKFINPSMPVTDYRTRWSGIRHRDLIKATPYSEARKEILRLLMGKVVIGHAIHNDFKVLGYSHPAALTRDTSRIPLLNLRAGFAEHECASLKRLTKAIFNRDIQTGKKGHSSVEDAKATMELYRVVEEEWERRFASKPQGR